jgi:antitoxin component YwqK of YwqJK toxin-antitoxin module
MEEVSWKGHKLDVLSTNWYDNWEKQLEENLKDGKRDGVWYEEDGTELGRVTYKDGKEVD